MISFITRRNHEITRVQDTKGNERKVCKCQVKERHLSDGTVDFPVFECPWLTKKTGFGTEEGIQ